MKHNKKENEKNIKNNKHNEAKDYRQLHHISTAAYIEESGHLKLVQRSVIAISLLVIALIIWAALVSIDESAITYGEIVPKGQVQMVQHLEGGIVTRVLVDNGDQVKKGQLLLTISPTEKRAELEQLQSREIALILDIERLQAYLNDQEPDAAQWSSKVINSKYNTVKNQDEIETLVANERQRLTFQLKEKKDQQSVIEALIAQRKEKLQEALNQKKVWDKQVELFDKEYKIYENLNKRNLIPHKDFLVVLREMNAARGEQIRVVSLIEQTKKSILEAENKLRELNSNLAEEASKELTEANKQLLEVRHAIEKIEDQLKRTEVMAPIAGIVKGVRVFAGNVVKPGGDLLEIVPLGEELIAETRVNPRDIGHIKIGDQVKIKILTYDYARYGSIPGILTNISASTFLDKEGRPFYKAETKLSKQYLTQNKVKMKLMPGMTVQADIITGKKTILQYLLKPIRRSTSSAFTER